MIEKKERSLSLQDAFLGFPFFNLDEEMSRLGKSVGFLSETGLTVSEDEENIYIEAQLPGLKSDDLEISFEKGVLWIKGEKKEEQEDKKKRFYKKASHSFSYRVYIPGEVEEKKEPEASYENGVVKIKFAKASESHPKKIPIKTR
jgi:HSP20 family protein